MRAEALFDAMNRVEGKMIGRQIVEACFPSLIPPPYNRFYMRHPGTTGFDQPNEPVGRLLGNRVLLLRVLKGDRQGQEVSKIPGFVMPDLYMKGYNAFMVLAVGPGEWVKRKKKRVWIQPQVEPKEYTISNHWSQAADHPTWHQPEYLDEVDGRGRVIVDARFLEISWKPQ